MCRIINSLCASKQSQLADIYRSRDDYVQPLFTTGSNAENVFCLLSGIANLTLHGCLGNPE